MGVLLLRIKGNNLWLDAGYWLLVAGCWILDTRYWMLDAGCWILDTGYWMLVAGCWLLDTGCWRQVSVAELLRDDRAPIILRLRAARTARRPKSYEKVLSFRPEQSGGRKLLGFNLYL